MSLKPGKRQIRSDKNKKLIYTCAIRLFREHGYQNVSVEDIVEASGMSVGTFYHYFKSKDELPVLFLETDLQNSFDEYEERVLIPNHESRVPILDQLCAFLIFAQSLPHEGGEDFLRVATMYMLKEGSEEVAYHYILDPDRPFARICRKLLREGQSCGEIRSDKTPEELFELISIFSNGIDQLCYMSRIDISVDEVYGGALEDFINRMIAAPQ